MTYRTCLVLAELLLLGAVACSSDSNGGDDSSNAGSSNGGNTSDGGRTAAGGAEPGDSPVIGDCAVFPPNDPWNTSVYDAEADQDWTERLHSLVGGVNLHPDFGGQGEYGIPINVVPEDQEFVEIAFDWYGDESDPGPYPFPGPDDVNIEGHSPTACDGDCHLLVVQQGACMLYEGYACEYQSDGWHCGSGAVWDLSRIGPGQRPEGWTSVDAAGLAVTPGILRYSEVVAGEVRHAIRFTVDCTTDHYVAPATHYAVPGGCDADDPNAPPMGLRVRLNRDFDVSGYRPNVQVILTAMQHYGMMLADNGSNFYFQGDADPAWSDDDLDELKSISSDEFEVVGPVGPLGP